MAMFRASSSLDRRRSSSSSSTLEDVKGKGKRVYSSATGSAAAPRVSVVEVDDAAHDRDPHAATRSSTRTYLCRASILSTSASSSSSRSAGSCSCGSMSDVDPDDDDDRVQDERQSVVGASARAGTAVHSALAYPRDRAVDKVTATVRRQRRRQSHDSTCSVDEDQDHQEEDDDGIPSILASSPSSSPSVRPRCAPSQLRRDSYMAWHHDAFAPVAAPARAPLSADDADVASSSPLPSLSPSRPPLFDDSDEDDQVDDDRRRLYYYSDPDDDDEPPLGTPTSPPSSRGGSVVRRASLGLVRAPVKIAAVNDPLLSPPPPPPPILTFGRRGTKSAWLPASPVRTAVVSPTPSSSPPSFPSTATTSPSDSAGNNSFEFARSMSLPLWLESNVLPVSAPWPPSPSPSTGPKMSLLTKSLRSLAVSLPNLQLSGLRPPMTSLDLEGFDSVESAPWRTRSSPGIATVSSRAASPCDYEAVSTVVQLQTFSTPSPSPPVSPPRARSNTTPPLVSPSSMSNADPSLRPQIATVGSGSPSPVIARYISNQRHLLMLSLELEMMRRQKISAPLRGRAMVVRAGRESSASGESELGMGSALRWELRA